MKKLLVSLVIVFGACFSVMAADVTEVWNMFRPINTFIVTDVDMEKAAKNGFETLSMAVNTAPTTAEINEARRLAATVNPAQKITSMSQEGVNVSVFAAPADTNGQLYKVMFVIDKNDNENKALIVLYGTVARSNMINAMQSLSVQDLIGG